MPISQTYRHKCWRYNYRFGGKQKTLAVGIYSDISLAKARSARMEAKNDRANGIDPAQKNRIKNVAFIRLSN